MAFSLVADKHYSCMFQTYLKCIAGISHGYHRCISGIYQAFYQYILVYYKYLALTSQQTGQQPADGLLSSRQKGYFIIALQASRRQTGEKAIFNNDHHPIHHIFYKFLYMSLSYRITIYIMILPISWYTKICYMHHITIISPSSLPIIYN